MIPRHCREVGVKSVSFPLTEENIVERASGESVYANTSYLLLNDGPDWAIVRIEKAREQSLFRRITRAEIVSLPVNTAYLEDTAVDVQNPSVMVNLLEEAKKDSLIVKGRFEHMSFVHKEKTTPLVVFDVVPPEPPKIVELADAALATGRIRKPIRVVPRIMDLNQVARSRATRYVMFPCYSSTLTAGLEEPKNVLYLDQSPRLAMPLSELTLIGCDVSMRTFVSIYGGKPPFIDMCPKNNVRDSKQPSLSRCCKIDYGHRIEGNTAYLSWGASTGEVEEAIVELLGLDLDFDQALMAADQVPLG